MLDTQRYKRTDTRFYKRKGPLEDRVEQDILRYGRPLNIEQESDIERMFTEIPELAIGNNATKGWAFCHPPTLAWEKDEFALDETGRYVVETYFSPFRWEAYIRGLRKFGIIPFKYKQIDEWQYPVMPPVGSGIIYQYYDKVFFRMIRGFSPFDTFSLTQRKTWSTTIAGSGRTRQTRGLIQTCTFTFGTSRRTMAISPVLQWPF